jgi:hypothetical protein
MHASSSFGFCSDSFQGKAERAQNLTTLASFDGTGNREYASAGLAIVGKTLFGMAYQSGKNGYGTIFSLPGRLCIAPWWSVPSLWAGSASTARTESVGPSVLDRAADGRRLLARSTTKRPPGLAKASRGPIIGPMGGVIRVELVKEAHSWSAFFGTNPATTVIEILEAFVDRAAIRLFTVKLRWRSDCQFSPCWFV